MHAASVYVLLILHPVHLHRPWSQVRQKNTKNGRLALFGSQVWTDEYSSCMFMQAYGGLEHITTHFSEYSYQLHIGYCQSKHTHTHTKEDGCRESCHPCTHACMSCWERSVFSLSWLQSPEKTIPFETKRQQSS
jgi:hypothetical protein